MPNDLAFTINGLAELRRAFRKAPQITETRLQKAIEASVFVLQSHNLKQDPTPWRTGNLLHSFDPPVIGRLAGRYFPRANYAFYVHEKERYKNGAPYPYGQYMPKMFDRSRKEINAILDTTLMRIVKELAA